MMKPQRWNDWIFLISIVCFVAAPLISLAILLGIEWPIYNELQASHDESTSGPGHFVPGGFINLFRIALTISAVATGLVLTLLGSIRIPDSAKSTRKLRDVTLAMFGFALISCIFIQIL